MTEEKCLEETPKKAKRMNSTTITMVVSSVVGGILLALQGATLHQADGVQRETARVGAETSVELRAIQELQKSSNEELVAIKVLQQSSNDELKDWADLRENVKVAMTRQADLLERQNKLADIAAKILPRLEKGVTDLNTSHPSPSPSPSP